MKIKSTWLGSLKGSEVISTSLGLFRDRLITKLCVRFGLCAGTKSMSWFFKFEFWSIMMTLITYIKPFIKYYTQNIHRHPFQKSNHLSSILLLFLQNIFLYSSYNKEKSIFLAYVLKTFEKITKIIPAAQRNTGHGIPKINKFKNFMLYPECFPSLLLSLLSMLWEVSLMT